MTASRFSLHELGLSVLRNGAARRAAFRVGAARGRSIALVYHRVTPQGAGREDAPPNMSITRFREQLEALGDVGDIVSLPELLHEPTSRRRVRIAITFDDDDRCHLEHALPTLVACGAPATFFLSGRTLWGLGAYWWMRLERLIAERGIDAAQRVLGVKGDDARTLAAACEGTPLADRLADVMPDTAPALLDEADIRALVAAGMQIGFHTLHHPVLPTLSGEALDRALTQGRERLAQVTGTPIDFFAYPHGRTSMYVAERVRAAGYRAAFRTGGRAIAPDTPAFMLGRLGTGALSAGDLVNLIALRLSRSPYPAAGPS